MAAVLPRRHELAVMGREGDTKTIWDPDNATEVEIAKRAFDEFKKKGFSIFRVEGEGKKGTQMHTFDPDAAKMIAVPRVVGG